MCTVVLLRRPGQLWPLILGANRDEMRGRPWTAPARHWPDRPEVVAGRDDLAGGTWLGLNDHGVVAAVLNRRGTLGPAPGLRSRGELALDALDHADAAEAASALAGLDARAFRPFHVVVADDRDAFQLRGLGPEGPPAPERRAFADGISMVTAHDPDDQADARRIRHLPRFAAAPPPDPDAGAWRDWEALLGARDDGGPSAMTVALPGGFGTSSSALIALPRHGAGDGRRAAFRFADGHPESIRWRAITI